MSSTRSLNHFDERYWQTSLLHILNEKEDVEAVLFLTSDETQKMLLEKSKNEARRALDLNEQHFKTLFEHHHDSVVWFNNDGRFISVNKAGQKMLGIDNQELKNLTFRNFIVPEDLEKTVNHFELAKQGYIQQYITRIKIPDSEELIISSTNIPMLVDGRVAGIFAIGKDITKEEKARVALKEKELQLSRIYDTVADIIFVLNCLDGGRYQIHSVNKEYIY